MTYTRKFALALAEELSKYSSRDNRAKVASEVYHAMKEKGFNLAIVNDRGFENFDEEPVKFEGRRTYWMRRNNGIDCYEVA